MPSDNVIQAIGLIKSGERGQARRLLVKAIIANPKDEDAWYLMAAVVGEKEKKLECLVRVLEINPKHDKAKRYLRKLIRTKDDLKESDQEKVKVETNKIEISGKRKYQYRNEWIFIAVVLCLVIGWSLISDDKARVEVRDAVEVIDTETRIPTQTTLTIETSEGNKLNIPGIAFLDGRDIEADPPLTIMKINLWDEPERNKIVCSLEHGTKVDILEANFVDADGRYYLFVEGKGCEGWISDNFLSEMQEEPIGD